LELNAYVPLIGHAILDSLKLLIAANNTLKENLFKDLKVNQKIAEQNLLRSPSITTALIPVIGYNKASQLAKAMRTDNLTIFEANEKLQLLEKSKIEELLRPDNMLKNGFSLKDLI
jgi:aspartate ammonia-lyase